MNYSYDSWGNPTDVVRAGSTLEKITYDEYGRRASLNDHDAGITNYVQDGFGRLTWQQDPNENVSTFSYDNHDRMLTRQEVEGITTFEYYYSNGAYTDDPVRITMPSTGVSIQNEYADPLLRCTKEIRNADGQTFVTQYVHDPVFNRPTSMVYPNGFDVQYSYFETDGTLRMVFHEGTMLYRTDHVNGAGQPDSYKKGDGNTTNVEYYNGYPLRISTHGVIDLHNSFDYTTGNLRERWDNEVQRGEQFTYDFLDRLTSATVSQVASDGSPILQLSQNDYKYDGGLNDTKGNLIGKTDVGKFSFGGSYGAVAGARGTVFTDPPAVINYHETQDIAYSSFSKTKTIDEKVNDFTYRLNYDYGVDHQRVHSQLQVDGSITRERWYAGSFERQYDETTQTTTEICYISAGDGLTAMAVRQNGGVDNVYYVYKDQLGSILALTQADGQYFQLVAQQSFDPWGRKRNPGTWASESVSPGPAWLYRGYTGHEQVDEFALINMNGRCYDPVLGRMLSADNFVQEGTQGFNRYTYALNNPLTHVDPDGENPAIVIGIMALAGAYSGGAIAAGNGGLAGAIWNPFDWGGTDWAKGAAIGAVLGAGAGWGITALGPVAANALYCAGLQGGGGLVASAVGYGGVGAIAGGAAGFGTGYLTDRYVNEVSPEDAMNTGVGLAKYGAALGATVGMTYGLTPGGFEHIAKVRGPGECPLWKDCSFPLRFPKHELPRFAESVRGIGTKWIDKTYWSTQSSVGTPIAGSTALQYALPNVPNWLGQPGYRGPFLWQSASAPNFNLNFFWPNGTNPALNFLGTGFPFPWAGVYMDNLNIDLALRFRQRVPDFRRGWSFFFGLFTIY